MLAGSSDSPTWGRGKRSRSSSTTGIVPDEQATYAGAGAGGSAANDDDGGFGHGSPGIDYAGCGKLRERVDDTQAVVVLRVAHILRVHRVAAEQAGGGEDRAIPVVQPEARTESESVEHQISRNVLHRKSQQTQGYEPDRFFVRHLPRPSLTGGLGIEFLEDLRRKGEVASIKQANRDGTFFRFFS